MLTRISGRPAAYEASHGHSINDYSDRLLLAALLVLAGLEVVLVARANDGGVTARLVEEPLAEGLLGTGLMGRLLLVDARSMEFHPFQLDKNPDCKVCGRPAAARAGG